MSHDPAYNKAFHHVKEFKGVIWKRSISEAIKGTDLIVIHTEWNEYRALIFVIWEISLTLFSWILGISLVKPS